MIAGKGPAGAIRAMHTRCQSDDQQTCLRIAEGGHWTAVIVRLVYSYGI